MQVLGQGRATELLQQNPALHRPVPDAQHVVDLLCVEHQEVEPERREEAGSQTALGPFFPEALVGGGHRPKDLQEGRAGSVIPTQPAPPTGITSNGDKGGGWQFGAALLSLGASRCHCQIPPVPSPLHSPSPHSCVPIRIILDGEGDAGSQREKVGSRFDKGYR